MGPSQAPSPWWGPTASPLPPAQSNVGMFLPQLLVRLAPGLGDKSPPGPGEMNLQEGEMSGMLTCGCLDWDLGLCMEGVSFCFWDQPRSHLASLTIHTSPLLHCAMELEQRQPDEMGADSSAEVPGLVQGRGSELALVWHPRELQMLMLFFSTDVF